MEKDWFQVNFGNWVIMILIGFRVIMVILVIKTIVERFVCLFVCFNSAQNIRRSLTL